MSSAHKKPLYLLFAFWLNMCLSDFAMAEYRVYKLAIINVDTQSKREVISSLDQYQYPDYHPVGQRERVDLLNHWMCWNRTSDFKAFCDDPSTGNALPPAQSAP